MENGFKWSNRSVKAKKEEEEKKRARANLKIVLERLKKKFKNLKKSVWE
jgi:hypothetical protein